MKEIIKAILLWIAGGVILIVLFNIFASKPMVRKKASFSDSPNHATQGSVENQV